MATPQSTRSRLRETLKQEDNSLSERLPAVAPASPSAANKAPAAQKPTRTAERKPVLKAALEAPAVAVTTSSAPSLEPDKTARPDADKKGKREKVARDSFSMPVGEHKRIKALRDALAKAGSPASKSEILRAGVALLAGRGLDEIVQHIAQLPKVPKGKHGKKH